MITTAALKALKRKLPGGWADKVKAKTGFGLTKIREALKSPDNYDPVIINAAIEIAEGYQKDIAQKAAAHKQRIQNLIAQ